jgi:hypothetical protein
MEMRFSDSWPPVPGDSSRGLRPIGWSELCARLVAAHDTRGVLAGTASGSILARTTGSDGGASCAQGWTGFSFHESAAVLLRSVEMEAEELVNPSSSANGNDVEGTQGAVPEVAPQRRPDEN